MFVPRSSSIFLACSSIFLSWAHLVAYALYALYNPVNNVNITPTIAIDVILTNIPSNAIADESNNKAMSTLLFMIKLRII